MSSEKKACHEKMEIHIDTTRLQSAARQLFSLSQKERLRFLSAPKQEKKKRSRFFLRPLLPGKLFASGIIRYTLKNN